MRRSSSDICRERAAVVPRISLSVLYCSASSGLTAIFETVRVDFEHRFEIGLSTLSEEECRAPRDAAFVDRLGRTEFGLGRMAEALLGNGAARHCAASFLMTDVDAAADDIVERPLASVLVVGLETAPSG